MQDDLATALNFHAQGYLDRAAQIYQALLAREPANPDAIHLLGVIALQQGQAARAAELIGHAIALAPGVAAYHANLAEAYRALVQLDRAVSCCQTALRLQPGYPEAANNLGLALLAQGKLTEAAGQFREALRMRPAFAMAANNLGNALRAMGERAQAAGQFRHALRLDPHLAEAQSNLGQLLLEQKDLAEALAHCQEAVRLRPLFAEAHSNLGNVLRELGRLDEAKNAYAEALRLNPGLGMVYNNVGQALQEEGRVPDAMAWYQRALQIEPGAARFHCNFASALEELENHDEAIARYELALRLDPAHAESHNGLGWVRHEQGHYHEAMASYREALRLKPDLAPAHCNLGTVLEELGDFDTARESFREALRQDPRHAGAYAQLAVMLKAKLPDEDLAAMRAMLADPYMSAGKRVGLHFGLAQVHDAKGQFEEAARQLQEANSLSVVEWAKRGKVYDPDEHARFVDKMITVFTQPFFDRTRGFGLDSERPIFIVGLPRSGTTLTEQILASHSQVFGAGELRLGREDFEVVAAGSANELDGLDAMSRMDSSAVKRAADAHLDQLNALDASAARVADKMPDNYMFLGLLAVLFPRAKFIHCRRDLRDIAVSCWMTNFRHIRWSSNTEHIASRFSNYQRLMSHWARFLPVPLLEVSYEETVADLEGVARRLVEWCGLEWEPACLAFHKGKRPVRTASVSQVRQPIYTRSVARWKHYESTLAPLFARLEALSLH
jgi:tetratricopeptide (TPR) repeat protein